MPEAPIAKNEQAWRILFARLHILEQLEKANYISITSQEINTVREARLMTKFDHSYQLPAIFREHGLGILPTGRGRYLIGRFSIFHAVEPTPPDRIHVRPYYLFESISPTQINSETAAIHYAHLTGILSDFTGDATLFPTLSGRMGTERFSFQIAVGKQYSIPIEVENAQIEIDAGYESETALYLIEAKNHLADDFIIRQLYYPYRLWRERIRKPIRLLYLNYTDGNFYLREYDFRDPEYYNSLRLLQSKCYVLDDEHFDATALRKLLATTRVQPESSLPFPQADRLERVINLCEILLQEGELTKADIVEHYGFVPRQADYYTTAGRYLGLIAESGAGIRLSDAGARIFSLELYARRIAIIECIASHAVFRQTLLLALESAECIPQREKVQAFLEVQTPGLSSTTYYRRTSTVLAWVQWVLQWIASREGHSFLFDDTNTLFIKK